MTELLDHDHEALATARLLAAYATSLPSDEAAMAFDRKAANDTRRTRWPESDA